MTGRGRCRTILHRRVLRVYLLVTMILIWAGIPAWGLQPAPSSDTHLETRKLKRPELQVSSRHEPLAAVRGQLGAAHRAALDEFGRRHGQEFRVQIDPRFGTPSAIVGHIPLIPGSGRDNMLTMGQMAAELGETIAAIDSGAVARRGRKFLHDSREALNIDPTQLGEVVATQVNDHLWQFNAGQQVDGIKVRGARLAATINHGNLVLLGSEKWGAVKINAKPAIGAEQALELGFQYVDGQRSEDEVLVPPTLEIVPTAPRHLQDQDQYVGPPGQGYEHRLVWTFVFKRPPVPSRWEVMIDARNGEVLSFRDLNQYLNAGISGGVYPLTSTGVCPTPVTCGTMQADHPMPFADTGLAAPNDFTNAAGLFDHPGGNAVTTLFGKYLQIQDLCGTISESSAGSIALGGSNGQHDCDAAGGSPGNTPAARSVFYEVNKLQEMARGYLPLNTWLQGQLRAYVNISYNPNDPYSSCNAYWDGSINFVRSSNGCRNTGELAAVFDHEWGHGLDFNDGNGYSSPSEAYADIVALFRLQTSCLGHGFFQTQDKGCGLTADGTGYNVNESLTGTHCALDCSGVRDADWDRHADHTPDTPVNFVCTHCYADPNGYNGPCGRQAHCEAAVDRQAAWDFAARDLQAPPFSYDVNTAFLVASRIFYLSSGSIGDWHSCSCSGSASNGCGATNAYLQWLAADDDDGDLNNGTPHMTAIYNAFNRHGIACAEPAPVNHGCAGAPTSAPVVTVIGGDGQVSLSWNGVSGATAYRVFRSEGAAGCAMGKTPMATTTGQAFTDNALANDRQYCYTVMAVGANEACFSPASACTCAVPALGPHGTLQGVVRDLVTNNPISGVTVTLTGRPAIQTDAAGFYQFASIPVGSYDVTATAYGYQASAAIPVTIGNGTVTTRHLALNPFTLVPVQGAVTDASGHGWPLYATVTVTATGYARTLQTDPATGRYSVALEPGVAHTFNISVAGYLSATRTITPAGGGMNEDFALVVDGSTCAAEGYTDNYRSYLYQETFEASDGGYTASPTVPWQTTTWAWGTPVAGPGTGHSGSRVWGTNLPGDYGYYEDGYVTSPIIDLSANAGKASYLFWWQWLSDQYYWDNVDATVEVSNDGGASWSVVYHPTGVGTATWTEANVLLSPAYSVSTFRIRFRWTNSSNPGLFIDDIAVGPATCAPLPGGRLVGNVLNGTTGIGINDAVVSDAFNNKTTSRATPDDPGLADGFYSLFLPAGTAALTVTRTGYGSVATTQEVTADAVTRRDLPLAPAPLTIVQGTVRDNSGHGWPLYATIEVTAPNFSQTVTTDPLTGAYSLSLFGNTTYAFTVKSLDYTTAVRTVTTASASMTEDFPLSVAYCTALGYGDPKSGGLLYYETFEQDARWTATDPVWQWMTPTYGPQAAHSGANVWGPLLNGSTYYGAGYITSPVIDLSANAGQVSSLSWWQWYDVPSSSYRTTVEVSKDGGLNWTPVYGLPADRLAEPTWTRHSVALDPSYAVGTFRVRFYYWGTTDQSTGWYVDDVAVQGAGNCPPVPGGLVVGNVQTAATGAAVNGATISDGEGRVTTTVATPVDPAQDDGFYRLFLPVGQRTLTALYGTTGEAKQLEVVADTVSRLNFSLVANGVLQGTVSNVATGAPLGGATVKAHGFGSTTTDAAGHYSFGNLPAGTYTATATHYGYPAVAATGVAVASGATVTRDFSLTELPPATITGTVTDASGHGWPLAARIEFVAAGQTTTTYAHPLTGEYAATLYRDLPYTVTSTAPGYTPSRQQLTIPAGGLVNDIGLTVDRVACNAPGYGVTAATAQTFEANDGGYSVSGTTSWAWGTPTSGPATAHSGARVWATNLAGNYNDGEDGFLTSPPLDLGPLAGQSAILAWWQWLTTEASYDFTSAEVSKDGGTTWLSVYGPVSGPVAATWSRVAVQLDPAYSVSDFRVRFRLNSDYYQTEAGWYLDDVALLPPSSCQPLPGGLVAGNVRAADTGNALNDTQITDLAGHTAFARATPELPTVADGFYALFLPTGPTTLIASHPEYGGEESLTVVADQITALDFTLGRCTYALAPASATFPAAGGTGSLTVTTGSGCTWAVTNLPAWLTVTGGGSGMGPGTVNYAVAANAGTTVRNGTFTIMGQTFTVNQGSNYGILGGYVSSIGGNPVGGAKITVGGQSAYTDASGLYVITNLLSGSYDGVSAWGYGYYTQSVSGITINPDSIIMLDFTLSPTPVVSFTGMVSDGSGQGWPLYASITIAAPGFTQTIYSDPVTGRFNTTLFQDTPYTVTVGVTGYTAVSREITAPAGGLNENFSLIVNPVSCTAPGYAGAYYSQSFESGGGGYTASGSNSSWAWGTPVTRGPASAHSGTRLWATNLSGYYNYYENSELTSPAIDMSGNAGHPLVLSWWQWTSIERYNDYASVEVSNNGGQSWTQVYSFDDATSVAAWTKYSVELDQSYAVSNFKMRFKLRTDDLFVSPGLYIDDISLSPASCRPVPGGLLAGNVYDAATSAPYNGATVQSGSGGMAVTGATPNDPALTDGFYSLFLPTGKSIVTASYPGYADYPAEVTPVAGSVIRRDFLLLPAGSLQGTITDATSGTPLAYALVTLSGGYATTTNLAGFYHFPAVVAGVRDLTVAREGYETRTISGIDVPVAVTTQNVTLARQALNLFAWGTNDYGQLGTGATSGVVNAPVLIENLADVIGISGGSHHTLVLKTDNTVWAWGGNFSGQLGDGTTVQRLLPIQIASLQGVTRVAAGGIHSIALKSDGTVWRWGAKSYFGGTYNSIPELVSGISGPAEIVAGGYHDMALKGDGSVWTWGISNSYGQFGNGTTTAATVAAQVPGLSNVMAIAAGIEHSVALLSDGTVRSWGRNDYGQLGDGTTVNRLAPVSVAGLSGIVAISAKGNHTLALKGDGTLWSWGNNGYGQLGDGTTTNRPLPVALNSLGAVAEIAAGYSSSLVVKADGTLWEWGVPPGVYTARPVPVQVAGLMTAEKIVATGSSHFVLLPFNIYPKTLAEGSVGTPYSRTLTAAGGKAPASWGVPTGTLPPGLTFAPATGTIAGTPGEAGAFTFSITATDGKGTQATQQYTLLVTTPGMLQGTVTSSATGQPLSGATVTATGGYSTTTDTAGAYLFPMLPRGTYDVTVGAADLVTRTFTGVVISSDATTTLDAALDTCVYTLSASAASYSYGAASGSLQVTAGPGCVWSVSGLPAWLTVSAGSSGSGNGTVSYNVAANGGTVPRSGTMSIAGQTFTVSQGSNYAVLQGTVIDLATGTPLSGATVTASGLYTATTDSAGFYRFSALIAGSHDLRAWAPLKQFQTVTGLVIQADNTYIQNFSLSPAPLVTVQGHVADGSGHGWPLYAKVEITGPGYSSTLYTDPVTGAFSASIHQDNPYTFTISSAGYTSLTRSVTPPVGGGTENFPLTVASCSMPGYTSETYYSETFDSGNGGFTTSGTTTWNWGTPTSGPGAAHSGAGVWATNLAGDYNNNENGYLTSPVIDLSANAGQPLSFSWWQWLKSESGYDYASVEVSNDGGTTWTRVYGPLSGNVSTAWGKQGVSLGAAYAVPNFRARFKFTSDTSVVASGWYVDDILIQGNCSLVPGGLVVGTVADAATGTGVNGAVVSDGAGHTATAIATPEDPGLGDGYYALFLPLGSANLTAASPGYLGGQVAVEVAANAVARRDFTLAKCTYALSPATASFSAAAGSGTIQVTVDPPACPWTVADIPPWLTVTAGSTGAGSGTISYSVAENTGTSPRAATLTIADQLFSVTQGSNYGTLRGTVTASGAPVNGATVAIAGGGSTVTNSSGNYQFPAIAAGSYTITVAAAGLETATVSVTVSNDQVTTSDVVLVACSYTLAPPTVSIGYAGGSGSFQVIAGPGCTWSVGNKPTWLTFTSASNGSGSGTVQYSVAANAGTSSRSASLTVANLVHSVVQGSNYGWVRGTVTVAGSGVVLSGVTVTVVGRGYVTTNSSGYYQFTNIATGTYTVKFYLAGWGEVTVSDVVVNSDVATTVNTGLTSCSYTLTPAFANMGYAGGPGSFQVNTAAGCSWVVSNVPSWLTITAGGSGSGPGTTSYTAATNAGTSSRTANLTVAGKSFALIQAGAVPLTVTVSPAGGGAVSGGSINCPGACGATFDSGADVLLTAVAASGYRFSSWSGCDTPAGNSCSLIMSATKNVTANFVPLLVKSGGGYFDTIQAAYNGVATGDTLQLKAGQLLETLLFGRDVLITLKGGFSDDFSSQSGETVISGSLTISAGEVTVENIAIQ